MPRTRLYMLRHFPTRDNEIEPGWSGEPIDPKRGAKLAERVAAGLAKRRIKLIVGSDLPRAVETMELLGKLLRVPIYPSERLRAWRVGDEFEGRPREEIEPELLFFRENPHLTPPGGESWGNFCATRQEAIRDLLSTAAAPPYPRIATVMHVSVLLLVPPTIEGRAPDPEKKDGPPPAKIITLEITPRGVTAEGL